MSTGGDEGQGVVLVKFSYDFIISVLLLSTYLVDVAGHEVLKSMYVEYMFMREGVVHWRVCMLLPPESC